MNMGVKIARSFDDAHRNSQKPITSLLGSDIVSQIKYWNNEEKKKKEGKKENVYAIIYQSSRKPFRNLWAGSKSYIDP